MKSLASLILMMFAGAVSATAQEPPAGEGPRGSSQLGAGEVRYDAVGHAARGALAGVSAASAMLPAGSYAEVTALDTGRTIVVAVVGGQIEPNHIATLSDTAADALGLTADGAAIRIRKVTPTAQDMVLLREGRAASFRAAAPQALLVALRKKLAPTTIAAAPVAAPPARQAARPATRATTPQPKPAPAAKPAAPAKAVASGYVVQVAALSNPARAAIVARAVGGTVAAGPPVWRVRLGPFADLARANQARAEAARKGYPGGQVTRLP